MIDDDYPMCYLFSTSKGRNSTPTLKETNPKYADLLSRLQAAREEMLEWSNDNPELIAILDRHLPETRV